MEFNSIYVYTSLHKSFDLWLNFVSLKAFSSFFNAKNKILKKRKRKVYYYYYINLHLGPDHVQLSKVFWGLKVNWKHFSTKIRKYFPIYFTSTESCALSKVNWNQQKSIGTNESQLEFISQLESIKNAEKYSYATYHMISPPKDKFM